MSNRHWPSKHLQPREPAAAFFVGLWLLGMVGCQSTVPRALAPLAVSLDRVELEYETGGRPTPQLPLLRDKRVTIGQYELQLRPAQDELGYEYCVLTLLERGRELARLNCSFRLGTLATANTSDFYHLASCAVPGVRGRLSVEVDDSHSPYWDETAAHVRSTTIGKHCFCSKRDTFDLGHTRVGKDPAVITVYQCASLAAEGIPTPGALLAAAVAKDGRLTLLLPRDDEVRRLMTLCLLLAFALETAMHEV